LPQNIPQNNQGFGSFQVVPQGQNPFAMGTNNFTPYPQVDRGPNQVQEPNRGVDITNTLSAQQGMGTQFPNAGQGTFQTNSPFTVQGFPTTGGAQNYVNNQPTFDPNMNIAPFTGPPDPYGYSGGAAFGGPPPPPPTSLPSVDAPITDSGFVYNPPVFSGYGY
jgi:hypothetical protein